jgi:hypothetical protein
MKLIATRIAAAIIGAGAIGVAAIWMHSLAVSAAFGQTFHALGAGSKMIVLVLLGLLVLLGCRHLAMLALATCDHWTHGAPSSLPAGRLPFVSIIVPAFNEGPMIAEVLESLLLVRYPCFEVIVVDDGSSDQTFLRALPFRRRRGVEYCVLTKSNGGKFDALNHGIAHARGEIVICIDGDSSCTRTPCAIALPTSRIRASARSPATCGLPTAAPRGRSCSRLNISSDTGSRNALRARRGPWPSSRARWAHSARARCRKSGATTATALQRTSISR